MRWACLSLLIASCTPPPPAPHGAPLVAAGDAAAASSDAASPGADAPDIVVPPEAGAPDPPTPPGPGPRFAVVVSFGSECCGTDKRAAAALDAVAARYAPAALGRTRGYWGKEGEFDECFTLEGLSREERAKLIAELRRRVARKLVTVVEGGRCRDTR